MIKVISAPNTCKRISICCAYELKIKWFLISTIDVANGQASDNFPEQYAFLESVISSNNDANMPLYSSALIS